MLRIDGGLRPSEDEDRGDVRGGKTITRCEWKAAGRRDELVDEAEGGLGVVQTWPTRRRTPPPGMRRVRLLPPRKYKTS
jgi:hypothetical protein